MHGPLSTHAWSNEVMVVAIHQKQRRRLLKTKLGQPISDMDVFVLNQRLELDNFLIQLAEIKGDYVCQVALYEEENHWLGLHIAITAGAKQFFLADSLGGYNNSNQEDLTELMNIVKSIRSAFAETDPLAIKIYLNRMKLQNDYFNCSRFTLNAIYSLHPLTIFDALTKANLASDLDDITHVTFNRIPLELAKMLRPLQSQTAASAMRYPLKNQSVGKRGTLHEVIEKYGVINSQHQKKENHYIEHKKDNIVEHIEKFLHKLSREGDLIYLLSQRVANRLTEITWVDVIQHIKEVAFWEAARDAACAVDVIDGIRALVLEFEEQHPRVNWSHVAQGETNFFFNKLIAVARQYCVQEYQRSNNFFSYDCCRIIAGFTKENALGRVIDDSYVQFFGPALRSHYQYLEALPEEEKQTAIDDLMQKEEIHNRKDVIFLAQQLPITERLRFIMQHAPVILRHCPNDKYAYDVILQLLPEDDRSDFMASNAFFKITCWSELRNILDEYIPHHEQEIFKAANKKKLGSKPRHKWGEDW